jgi:RNA polymerase sigma-70 factor (ECF subfamily)
MTDQTDAELVQRCRAGDAHAFDALVRRHYRAAYAVAFAVMRNAMDAEDVVQDGFVKALERLDVRSVAAANRPPRS